jgi:hypothetical protein
MRISGARIVTDHGSRFESRTGCLEYDSKLGNLAVDTVSCIIHAVKLWL